MQIYVLFKTKQILNSGKLIDSTFTFHLDKEHTMESMSLI